MKCIKKFISNYKINNTEEIIDYPKYLDAIRRKDKDAFEFLLEHLKKKTKSIVYKYYAILKPYGVSIDNLYEHHMYFTMEFLSNFENTVENFIAYYKGYLKHKFYALLEKETTEKNKLNAYADSFEREIRSDNSGSTLYDVVSCNESITQWYNGKEILDRYIYNNKDKTLSFVEKKIIHQRLIGNSFKEIAEENNISYKVCITIYQKAIDTLKNILNV